MKNMYRVSVTYKPLVRDLPVCLRCHRLASSVHLPMRILGYKHSVILHRSWTLIRLGKGGGEWSGDRELMSTRRWIWEEMIVLMEYNDGSENKKRKRERAKIGAKMRESMRWGGVEHTLEFSR